MGYRHKIPRIHLDFEEGHDYHGCEAVLRRLTLGEWLEITGMGAGTPEVRHVGDQLRKMADKLISWNLEEEDGTPVPTTQEAVLAQDQALMLAILNGWMDSLSKEAEVPAPLEPSSPDGEPFPEASLPMEPLSDSLVS
ncbi:hypothetical protein ACFWTC_03250 [Streptomyces sp. NPDC058619]|uniref:hypothetical protein n=1 Tax=unclassified Streptomyces TaxID=2593676 RepID=UPI00365B7D92